MQPMLNQLLNVLFDGGSYGESGCPFIEKKKKDYTFSTL